MEEQDRYRFNSHLERNKDRLGQAIHELWDSRDQEAWAKDPYFFLHLGAQADTLGQAMFAHDVLREGLLAFPGHLQITQRYCLSSIKCGFLLTAKDLLTGLLKDQHFDEETLGILGRVYKEMWLAEGDGAPGHPHLAKSRELYLGAFKRSGGYYSGINAASLSLIMGDKDLADRVARRVLSICGGLLRDPSQRSYWVLATVAEAYLLLGKQEKAAEFCGAARGRNKAGYSNLASTRRQFTLLSRYARVDPGVLSALKIPPVVAFTGHMIDAPGQTPPRFPQSAAASVKRSIEKLLNDLDVSIGFASAACGADLLFHECLQARGGESNVVLPFNKEDFFNVSVVPGGREWEKRARDVLGKSTSVEQATRGGYSGGNEVLFSYANRLIMGKAILRSRFLETEPLLIAVWDGEGNGKPGGSSECIRMWERTGFPMEVVRPDTAAVLRRDGKPPSTRTASPESASTLERRTVSILFADMVGYSKLSEDQIPAYVNGFLAGVSKTLASSESKPFFTNTWGDAVCLAFDDPLRAAECAIELRDMVRKTDWSSLDLPGSLNVRIGLHAGPVYCLQEPLLGRLNVFGFHVNQAARIEPITSPGNVYASESFASLLLMDSGNRLECRYVGVIVLPKNFGSYPIYHIKRGTEVG